jgi:hypothetical protein
MKLQVPNNTGKEFLPSKFFALFFEALAKIMFKSHLAIRKSRLTFDGFICHEYFLNALQRIAGFQE